MPEQGDEGLEELLKDLYRELTPLVRNCLFGGMALGFGFAMWFVLQAPDDAPPDSWSFIVVRASSEVVFFIVVGVTVTGALLGTAIGVVAEVLTGGRGGSGKKKPVRKRPRRKNRE